ncbi:MAG: hypothetical protein RIE59_26130 [Imperialibacter sp.]
MRRDGVAFEFPSPPFVTAVHEKNAHIKSESNVKVKTKIIKEVNI